jgi:hypothetical protein
MNDVRQQPLAGAGLTLQQEPRDYGTPEAVEGGEVAELGAQGRDGGRRPHQAAGCVSECCMGSRWPGRTRSSAPPSIRLNAW